MFSRDKSFQFITCLHPVEYGSEFREITTFLSEFKRLLSHRGFLLLGMKDNTWENQEVFDMLKRKKSEGEYELLAVQWIDLIDPADTAINKGEGNVFYMALLRSP